MTITRLRVPHLDSRAEQPRKGTSTPSGAIRTRGATGSPDHKFKMGSQLCARTADPSTLVPPRVFPSRPTQHLVAGVRQCRRTRTPPGLGAGAVTMPESPIVRFYRGESPDHRGRTLREIRSCAHPARPEASDHHTSTLARPRPSQRVQMPDQPSDPLPDPDLGPATALGRSGIPPATVRRINLVEMQVVQRVPVRHRTAAPYLDRPPLRIPAERTPHDDQPRIGQE